MLLKLLFLLIFLFSAGCSSELVVSGGVVNRGKLREVQAGVAAMRGLKFKAEVPVEVKNRAEMKRYFERDIEEEYGEEKLKNLALAYAKLGLFPQGVDLKKALVDFYGAQVVAFYDPRTKKLVLPESLATEETIGAAQSDDRRDIIGEMVLAHELMHALQDQHFSLGERMSPSSTGDKDLALRAVAEGDATLSGFGYLFGGLDQKYLVVIKQGVQDSIQEARSSVGDIPEAIVEELLFQYYGGVSFVSRLLEERGWSGVDRVYASPPLSTEQVLHPEKYLVSPDPPTRVEIKDLSALFPPDWKEIENAVLGELMTQVLFKRFLSEDEAKMVAGGWDGDRFVAFSRGDEIAFIWATVWDSPQDAEEFFQGYQRIVAKKYPDPKSVSAAYNERRDQRVVVVEGLEKDQVKERIEKIWQGMELTEEPFISPFPEVPHRLPEKNQGGAAHQAAP